MRTEGRRSSRLLEWMVILAVPALLVLCAWLEITQAAVLTFFAAILAIIPFFFRFEGADPKPRDIMPPVVMAALATAGQLVFAPVASFKPVGAVIIVTAIAFGRQTGFVTGALTALSSNMFFGQGPCTPLQMFAWCLIGYLAGTFSERGWFRHRFFVYLYGFLSGLIFGLIMDSGISSALSSPDLEKRPGCLRRRLPMNLTLSVATLLFLLPILEPWSRKLTRIKRKFDLSDGQQSR